MIKNSLTRLLSYLTINKCESLAEDQGQAKLFYPPKTVISHKYTEGTLYYAVEKDQCRDESVLVSECWEAAAPFCDLMAAVCIVQSGVTLVIEDRLALFVALALFRSESCFRFFSVTLLLIFSSANLLLFFKVSDMTVNYKTSDFAFLHNNLNLKKFSCGC